MYRGSKKVGKHRSRGHLDQDGKTKKYSYSRKVKAFLMFPGPNTLFDLLKIFCTIHLTILLGYQHNFIVFYCMLTFKLLSKLATGIFFLPHFPTAQKAVGFCFFVSFADGVCSYGHKNTFAHIVYFACLDQTQGNDIVFNFQHLTINRADLWHGDWVEYSSFFVSLFLLASTLV